MNKQNELLSKPAVANRTSPIFMFSLVVVFGIAGLIVSLKIAMALFSIDADSSHSIMLWQGVREHGISWIKDWIFTQDNWLLSLVPIHFLGYFVFGPNTAIPLVFGWIIYVSSALVGAGITSKLGGKRASIFVFFALINFGLYAHISGFVSYSTSHNISNLWGLTSIFLIINWLKRPTILCSLLLYVVLTAGAVSDPWMLASYHLPLLLTVILLAFIRTKHVIEKNLVILAGLVLLSVISVQTKLFGVLNFLPGTQFAHGNWLTVKANAIYLIRDLGGLLNLYPFSGGNSLRGGAITLLIFSYLFLHALYYVIKAGRAETESAPAMLFVCFATMSGGAIFSAFIITNVAAGDYSGRFLISVAYVLIISLGVMSEYIWKSASSLFRRSLLGFCLLFHFTSFSSIWPIASGSGFGFRDAGLESAVDFFKKNMLSYGYGPYWGASANAITAFSNNEIRLRPVRFDANSGQMIVGNRGETSKRWYVEEDVPIGTRRFFVVVASDGEECPEIRVCLDGLKKQFGNPIESLSLDNRVVLVWDHKLIGYNGHIDAEKGRIYSFNASGDSIRGKGWSQVESWGTWIEGNAANISFNVKKIEAQNMEIQINGNCSVAQKIQQNVSVLANGHLVGVFECSSANNLLSRSIVVSNHHVLKDGTLVLGFEMEKPAPLELGIPTDSRKFEFGLVSIEFK